MFVLFINLEPLGISFSPKTAVLNTSVVVAALYSLYYFLKYFSLVCMQATKSGCMVRAIMQNVMAS